MDEFHKLLISYGIDPVDYEYTEHDTDSSDDSYIDNVTDSISDTDSESNDELSSTDLTMYKTLLSRYGLKSDINIESIKALKSKSCDHYKNRCKIYCKQCDELYDCWKCHNNESAHEIKSTDITEIECIYCNKKQEWSTECIECNIPFGDYTCKSCKVLDISSIDMFHCDDCNICYLGSEDEFKHCSKCKCCMDITFYKSHKCIKNRLKNNCSICMESLTNGELIKALKCGHVLHQECYESLLGNNEKCPLCGKTIIINVDEDNRKDLEISMSVSTKNVDIYCKDCEKKSNVKFYYAGLKCPYCNSYNTNET